MPTPVKIVHTADVHLDLCFAGAGMPGSFGNRRRQSLRDVFHGIVRRAGEWPADALLIAGDLFESDRVTRDTIAFLKAEFASIPHVAVVIAPGNHDPFTPTSPYATETWPVNVTIFKRPEWDSVTVRDGALTVHGFAFDGPDVSCNPFGTLRIPSDESVHVAVAHGSERSHQPEGKSAYAPFDAHDAAADGLAYLALGHFHGYTPIEGSFGARMAYSGSPEGHGFRETGEHHFVEVTVDTGTIDIRPVPSARVWYETHRIDCAGLQSSQDIVRTLRGLAEASPKRLVARVALAGASTVDVAAELESIYDAVSGHFEFLELRDETTPLDDYEALAREETSLGLFVRALNEEIADQTDAARRDMVARARELGVAAFRERRLSIRGLEREDS